MQQAGLRHSSPPVLNSASITYLPPTATVDLRADAVEPVFVAAQNLHLEHEDGGTMAKIQVVPSPN
jgi:hypothetical protein